MARHWVRFSVVAAFFCALSASSQEPQKPAAGANPFAGRWEIQMVPSKGQTLPFQGNQLAFLIIEIESSGSALSGKVIDVMGSPMMTAKLLEVSAKDDQIVIALDTTMMGKQFKLKFQGKRNGDHLEGTSTSETDPTETNWVGRSTTRDKLEAPQMSTEQKAYSTAMTKPPSERPEALRQFLKDYPNSSLKEQATLQLAQSLPNPDEKIAALNKFQEDFPNSSLKDQANLQIALAPPNPADKAAALHKYLQDFPSSKIKDQAEYQLIGTITDPAERQAAQEKFVKDYPKSALAGTAYRSLFDVYVRAKPIDETKLNGVIEGIVNSSPDMSMPVGNYQMNLRASSLNTMADRLMVNEVMLDKALELIQKAVAVSDKADPQTRSMYITTLGQVQYKRKDYDQAEKELKRAIEVAGAEGAGEAQLYLGMIYEARNNQDAALDAYLNAASLASSKEVKTALERTYTKKFGSLTGLEEKLDDMYRARPKPFEAGHYTRSETNVAARVVLAELFTGAECGPCIASDLAFDGLGERYDHNTVAVLVYHLHIPGPDPMTNSDTEARSKYYQVRGTPTAMIDGLDSQVGGGGSSQASKIFADYKGKIEARVDKQPLASLTGFQVKVDGQTVTVSGQADLTPEGADKADKARLYVALVQETIRYTGANGIRFHNLVVRKLLGSPEGTVLQKPGTKTIFSEAVNVAALGDNLKAYLEKYEVDRSARLKSDFKFSAKLDRIDPKQLLAVAFVQDDQTKEILQATFVKPSR
jgi:tetratricopeptide (TPR) repeat protein